MEEGEEVEKKKEEEKKKKVRKAYPFKPICFLSLSLSLSLALSQPQTLTLTTSTTLLTAPSTAASGAAAAASAACEARGVTVATAAAASEADEIRAVDFFDSFCEGGGVEGAAATTRTVVLRLRMLLRAPARASVARGRAEASMGAFSRE